MDSKKTVQPILETQKALENIRYSEPECWVHEPQYTYAQGGRQEGEPVTQFLVDIQHNAETGACFTRIAQRLENMNAVQALSQWKLAFEPSTQTITIHTLSVTRDGATTHFTQPENLRILQREENLESFILHGEVTLLVVLENIRPGDIIEYSYTRTYRPHILPEKFTNFQPLRSSIHTQEFRYSVQFSNERPIQWKASAPEYAQGTVEAEEHTRLEWFFKNLEADKPEANTPAWEYPSDWIQVSDIADWSTIASAAHNTWPYLTTETDSTKLQAEATRLQGLSTEPLEQIEQAIRFVQDEFRYLSINLTVGGQIPAHPDQVLQRRYGDCKDLSLLLCLLLQQMGHPAKVVLVNEADGKSLQDRLPSPNLFNHAIIQFSYANQDYWIDATLTQQGGGPLNRATPAFTFGLPIQAESAELIAQPQNREQTDSLLLHDTIMLDTAVNDSILRVQTTATGKYADAYRAQLANEGVDGFNEASKTRHQNRYETGESSEAPVYEDDRTNNTWRMVEIYQLPLAQNIKTRGPLSSVSISPDFALSAIPTPERKARTTAYALEYPLDITQKIEIRNDALIKRPVAQNTLGIPGVDFQIQREYPRKRWTRTLKVKTSTDHITREDTEDLANLIQQVSEMAQWTFQVPSGVIRPHREPNFFSLPGKKRQQKLSPVEAEAIQNKRKQIATERAQPQVIAAHPEAATSSVADRSTPKKTKLTKVKQSSTSGQGKRAKRKKTLQLTFVCFIIFIALAAIWITLIQNAPEPVAPEEEPSIPEPTSQKPKVWE